MLALPVWAEVIYVPLQPPHFENRPLSRFLIDVDQNNKADLALWLFVPLRQNTFRVSTFDGHAVAGNLKDGLVEPRVVQAGTTIDASLEDWISGGGESVRFSSPEVNAPQTVKGYLACRLLLDNGAHYAWVEVELRESEDAFVVTGYAFETTRDKPIAAGDRGATRPMVPTVPNIYLADVGDAGNASDFYLHFLPAEDESGIFEYRVSVAPADANLNYLLMPESRLRYLTLVPEGRDLGTELPANLPDLFGEAIEENRSYCLVVWSKPRPGSRLQPGYTVSAPMQLTRPPVVMLENPPLPTPNTVSTEKAKTDQELPPIPKAEAPPPDDRYYPKVRIRDAKLFAAGKIITLKVDNEDWSPDAIIAVFDKAGQTLLVQRRLTGVETVINMEMYPEGIYLVRVNLNGTLLKRPLFLR
ncbi:MAG: hypothetical protein ACFB10_05935 [Salibacteraceae bacterium]